MEKSNLAMDRIGFADIWGNPQRPRCDRNANANETAARIGVPTSTPTHAAANRDDGRNQPATLSTMLPL
jgi:hypothetical protein